MAEALKIGIIVRRYSLHTFVDSKCASACFFLWISGIYRVGVPEIHRPYNPDKKLRFLSLKQSMGFYKRVEQDIAEFLVSIDVEKHFPSNFVDIMLSVEPKKAMSLDELNNLSPNLFNRYEPGIEQFLLDGCGSLDNGVCTLNKMFENALIIRPN